MLKFNDDGSQNPTPAPSHYQTAFAVLSLEDIQKWAWERSEEAFCEKMRQEIGWQSAELGFRDVQITSDNFCCLSRHIDFQSRTDWLWIAGRCKGLIYQDGAFALFGDDPIEGVTPEQASILDRKAASGAFKFLRTDKPASLDGGEKASAQLMTQGGFFMPTEHMAQERLQHVLRKDPHALLLTPKGPDVLQAALDRELHIYSMVVDDERVEVRFDGVEEDFRFEPYQVYHAIHTRGHDVNAF